MTRLAKKEVADLMGYRVPKQQSMRQSELLRHCVCTVCEHRGVVDAPEAGHADATPRYVACASSRLRNDVKNHGWTSHVSGAGFRCRDVAVGPVHTNGGLRQNLAEGLAGLPYFLRPQLALIVYFKRNQYLGRLAAVMRGERDRDGADDAGSGEACPRHGPMLWAASPERSELRRNCGGNVLEPQYYYLSVWSASAFPGEFCR